MVMDIVAATVDGDSCCDEAFDVAAGATGDAVSEVAEGVIVGDEPANAVVVGDERGT